MSKRELRHFDPLGPARPYLTKEDLGALSLPDLADTDLSAGTFANPAALPKAPTFGDIMAAGCELTRLMAEERRRHPRRVVWRDGNTAEQFMATVARRGDGTPKDEPPQSPTMLRIVHGFGT